ncbi:hypothetical protein WBG78_20045 [Chryseolinea sp. T2]|uniref:hypothetical protein n=1 Tax=Chryseolinea sp. T2 TaxID=3129255 RepID=UPI00307726C9
MITCVFKKGDEYTLLKVIDNQVRSIIQGTQTFRLASAISVFAVYLYLSSDLYGILKMRQVKKAKETSITLADDDVFNGLVIGKTKEVLFTLKGDKVTAMPLSSLKSFDVN